MTLTLTIENHSALPDGGPLSISLSGRRGIDIGRDQYLDWTLPDPDRVISGKHAEIRHRDGGYWLHDVSRNGVFVNRNAQRLQEAYRLKDGDRIQIGHYVILARIDGDSQPAQAPAPEPSFEGRDCWDLPSEAPPIPSRHLRPRESARPANPDFLDWMVDLPDARASGGQGRPEAGGEVEWLKAPAPLPTPRRPAGPADFPPEPPREAAPTPPAFAPFEPPQDNPWVPPAPPQAPPAAEGPLPPPAAAAPLAAPDPAAFVRRLAAGLGMTPDVLAWKDPGDLAEEVGALLRLNAENVKQLLAARTESKRAVKAANQTTVQALDNNPLKFSPTVDDALRIMFGPPSRGYLGAHRAMDASFKDLKTHQVKTYAAMQNALRLLTDGLSPEGIEALDEKDHGLGALLSSRKARLWDIYTTRWNAIASMHEEGMLDAFMIYFSDCYDNSR